MGFVPGWREDYFTPFDDKAPGLHQLPNVIRDPYGSPLLGQLALARKYGNQPRPRRSSGFGPTQKTVQQADSDFNKKVGNYFRMSAFAHPYLRGRPVGTPGINMAQYEHDKQLRYNHMIKNMTHASGGSFATGFERSPVGVPRRGGGRTETGLNMMRERLLTIRGTPPIAKMVTRGGGGGGGPYGQPSKTMSAREKELRRLYQEYLEMEGSEGRRNQVGQDGNDVAQDRNWVT